jgi:hypothetical protein
MAPLDHASRRLVLTLGGAAAVAIAIGLFVVVGVAPGVAERDRAVFAFFQAYRDGDVAAVERLTAKNAKVDRDFLEREVPLSKSFELGDNSTDFHGDSCVRGLLLPNRVQVVLFLRRRTSEWQVLRAAQRDSECEPQLDL